MPWPRIVTAMPPPSVAARRSPSSRVRIRPISPYSGTPAANGPPWLWTARSGSPICVSTTHARGCACTTARTSGRAAYSRAWIHDSLLGCPSPARTLPSVSSDRSASSSASPGERRVGIRKRSRLREACAGVAECAREPQPLEDAVGERDVLAQGCVMTGHRRHPGGRRCCYLAAGTGARRTTAPGARPENASMQPPALPDPRRRGLLALALAAGVAPGQIVLHAPARVGERSVRAGPRVRLSALRRPRAVDAPRSRRRAGGARDRALGARERRRIPHRRPPGQRDGRRIDRPQRARRGGRPRALALVLVPVHRRRRAERDRAHAHGARARTRGAARVRDRVVPALRRRPLRGLAPPAGRGARPGRVPRRLHLRERAAREPRAHALGPRTRARRSTTTARATPSTSPTPTSGASMRRRRGSSPGTTTRSRTTTRRTAARTSRRISSRGARPPTRRGGSTCRCRRG